MEKRLKVSWVLLFAALLALPTVTVRAGDDDDAEVSASDDSSPRRKLAGAEDGAEDDSGEKTAEKSDDSGEESTTASTDGEETSAEEKDERAERIFKKLKAFVKKLDGSSKAYPNPLFESAIRNEFLRQAEGKRDFPWLRGKKLDGADRTVAQDTFELFFQYVEKLGAAKKGAKDADLMAVKSLIDKYGRRGIAANEPPDALGKTGRAELGRQNVLLGKLVAGPGYEPLKFAKIDDAGKAYKARLVAARAEYEKLAKAMGGSKKVVKRDASSGDRKPASTKGKKDGKKKNSKGKKKK